MTTLWGNAYPLQRKFFTAAEPLLERYGYRKTTVEEICRAAGVSKRSFYELFRDKGELLAKLTLAVAESLVVRWEARLVGGESTRTRLELYLDEYVAVCRERPVLHQIFDDLEIISRHPEFSQQMMDSPLIIRLGTIITEGVESGEFRRQDPASTTMIIFALMDTMHILMPKLLNMPGALEDENLARELRTFILAGIGLGETNETA